MSNCSRFFRSPRAMTPVGLGQHLRRSAGYPQPPPASLQYDCVRLVPVRTTYEGDQQRFVVLARAGCGGSPTPGSVAPYLPVASGRRAHKLTRPRSRSTSACSSETRITLKPRTRFGNLIFSPAQLDSFGRRKFVERLLPQYGSGALR